MNMQQQLSPSATLSHPFASAAAAAIDTESEMTKLDRKRSQDRLHQRRHRAKRKQQLSVLEQDVKDLQAEVAALGSKRQRLGYVSSPNSSSNNKTSASVSEDKTAQRAAMTAHALQVVREYLQVFKYGHSSIHQDAQEKFLRRILRPDVAGVDISGVDAFAEQWRLYGAFFWSMLLESKAMHVRSTGELTIVEVEADVHLRFRVDLGSKLCPQLAHHQELLQAIADNVICVGTKYTFIVEQDGQVSGLMTEVEFIDALYRVVGSLAKVSQVVDGAQISMCSGKITCKPPVFAAAAKKQPAPVFQQPAKATKKPINGALNYRLQVNYLLSSSS